MKTSSAYIYIYKQTTHFFLYKQLNFQSQPGVANDFFQNEAESCLLVARLIFIFLIHKYGQKIIQSMYGNQSVLSILFFLPFHTGLRVRIGFLSENGYIRGPVFNFDKF